ncbi:MAG: dihydrofolate reductase [Streptosporangiaceae bacterium]
MILAAIVAADTNDVIGRDGDIPWHLPDDLRRFKRLTSGHVVVMGRLTHESIVNRLGRPLPNRVSVVVSTTVRQSEGVILTATVPEALSAAASAAAELATGQEIFVIGGASIYQQTLDVVDKVHLTRVHHEFGGDTVMPQGWLDQFTETSRETRTDDSGLRYSYLDYLR